MGVARRRARLATVVAVALLGAACSAGGEKQAGDTSTASSDPSPSPSASPSTTGPTDERPTTDPPGPLEEAEAGDDLLVVGAETLPDDLVRQILDIEVGDTLGVAASELFSVRQISIESKTYTIAAVDPASYRRFTGTQSAQFQDQWDRVAGGEVAVLQEYQDRLPIDRDDYLSIGTGEVTTDIHVGAYSPGQVGTVDMVVNEGWGERLGFTEDNALVINTLGVAPQAVKKQLTKLLPEGVGVTDLDAVAEYGLDIGSDQSVVFVGTFADAVGVFNYTPIGGGRIAPDPAWVRSHIVTQEVPILGSVTCNRYLMPQLRAALIEIVQAGLAPEIHRDEYAGCYYPRYIAGSTNLSNHSFGLALDLNVPGNQRGTVGEIHRGVVAIFKKWGFAWGGDWNYTDPMHFELDHLVKPQGT